ATADMLVAAGALQLGCTNPKIAHADYPANFPQNGNWAPVVGSNPPSPGVYAASIPGVLPSSCTTWFQAEQACALSGHRLLSNQEWQRGAAGTPAPIVDNGVYDCNIGSALYPVDSGSRSSCKSAWQVFDMVGNVDEWVADWGPMPQGGCHGWAGMTDDAMCL